MPIGLTANAVPDRCKSLPSAAPSASKLLLNSAGQYGGGDQSAYPWTLISSAITVGLGPELRLMRSVYDSDDDLLTLQQRKGVLLAGVRSPAIAPLAEYGILRSTPYLSPLQVTMGSQQPQLSVIEKAC